MLLFPQLVCVLGIVVLAVNVFVVLAAAEVTHDSIQKNFEQLVMGKYIDKVPKLDLVTPGVEPEKAK